jgi:hypothetical protein
VKAAEVFVGDFGFWVLDFGLDADGSHKDRQDVQDEDDLVPNPKSKIQNPKSEGPKSKTQNRRQAGARPMDLYHRQTIVTARAHAALLGLCDRSLDATLLTAAVRGDRWFVAVCGDGVVAMKDREGRIHVRSVTFAEGLPRYLNYAADPARRAAFLARQGNHWSVERLVLEADGSVTQHGREALPAGLDVVYWEAGAVAEYAWVAVLSDGSHSFTEARATETGRTSAPVPSATVLRDLLAFKNTNGVFVQRRLQRLLRAAGSPGGYPYPHHDDLALGVIEFGV